MVLFDLIHSLRSHRLQNGFCSVGLVQSQTKKIHRSHISSLFSGCCGRWLYATRQDRKGWYKTKLRERIWNFCIVLFDCWVLHIRSTNFPSRFSETLQQLWDTPKLHFLEAHAKQALASSPTSKDRVLSLQVQLVLGRVQRPWKGTASGSVFLVGLAGTAAGCKAREWVTSDFSCISPDFAWIGA